MNEHDVLATLQAMGTEQNRKVYRRHGVGENMYGVSFANLGSLKKKIKIDHGLAQKLWATGNHDARVLATMIADPKQANDKLLESWMKDLSNYVITDAFSVYASQTPLAGKKMEKWMTSKNEWIGQAGWSLLARLAMNDQTLPDSYFENYLETIERDIHTSRNRVRHAMNGALIAIGIRNNKLQKKAMAAAKRIGKVDVDHGETDCQTPDAAAYIQKTVERQKQRAAKA
jgi:3-methyladenine DNA glycosylase AlkD